MTDHAELAMPEENTINERYISERLSGGLGIGMRKWIAVFAGTAIYMIL